MQRRLQGFSLDFAKTGLAAQLKYFVNLQLLSQLNFVVEVKERPTEKICQSAANRGFASAHETRERNHFRAGSWLAGLIVCAHDNGGSIAAVITPQSMIASYSWLLNSSTRAKQVPAGVGL